MAAGIAYLASGDASFATGLEPYIDGGYLPASDSRDRGPLPAKVPGR